MDATFIPDMEQLPTPPPSLGRARGPVIQPDAVMGVDTAIDEMQKRAEEQWAPKYPSWLYKTNPTTGIKELAPPRKPEGTEFEDWMTSDMMLWGDFLRRVRYDLSIYRGMSTGAFRNFNPDTDDAYWSREIAIQVNKIASMIAGSPHQIRYNYRSHQEREWAAMMEDFSMWLFDQWSLHHRAGGNSALKWDMAWYALVEGRIATHFTCDLEDGDYPWWDNLVDPATCFPLWGHGKRGLIRVSREYSVQLGEVLDAFDPEEGKGVRKKLAANREVGEKEVDLSRDVQVRSCHTRWHSYFSVDGIELDLIEHEYGFVPFVYNLATGEAGTASMPGGDSLGPTAREIKNGAAFGGSTSKSRDYAHRGQSFFHNVVSALYQKNKLLGLHMMAAEQAVNPATQTITPYTNRPPEAADLRPGKDNQLRPGEQRAPVIPSPRPMDSDALLGALNAEASKALLPDQVFGHTEGSNITGFASDTLIAAALDIVGPTFLLVSDTIGDSLHMATLEFRNHGVLADGLSDGKLIIPQQNRGSATGAKPTKLPPWASEALKTVMEKLSQPGMPMGPPMPPPPPEAPGMLPTDPSLVPPGGPGERNDINAPRQAGPPPGPRGGAAALPPPGVMESGVPPPDMMGGAAPAMMGAMGGMGAMQPPMNPMSEKIGLPGFVDPMWTIPEDGINEDEPVVYIDRVVIDGLSGRPIVALNNLSLNNKTVLINYLTQAVDAKLMPRSIAMAQLPENTNVVEAFKLILAEEGVTNPEMLKNIYYPRSLAENGDFEGWLTYWLTILLPQMLPILNPAGMMPPEGAAPAGGDKGQAPIKDPAGTMVTGRSAAQLGRGPGSQGQPVGRPG